MNGVREECEEERGILWRDLDALVKENDLFVESEEGFAAIDEKNAQEGVNEGGRVGAITLSMQDFLNRGKFAAVYSGTLKVPFNCGVTPRSHACVGYKWGLEEWGEQRGKETQRDGEMDGGKDKKVRVAVKTVQFKDMGVLHDNQEYRNGKTV